MAAKVAMAGAALAAAVVSLGGVGGSAGAATATPAPGVTSNSITVGTISTQTGPISSNFSSLIYGEEGYFKYINAQGGINGRQINLKYTLDDGGNPSQFTQLANTLINQDHVFAVTGVATAFFTPNIFVESKTPTYGYNVTNNWARAAQPLRRRRIGPVPPGRGAGRCLCDPVPPRPPRSPSWPTASPRRRPPARPAPPA